MTLDVVIRMHRPDRLEELSRAVFSAALADHRDLSVIVVCQRFDAAGLAGVERTLAPIRAIVPEVAMTVLNREDAEPVDARAALMNQGLAAGQGRYAAFLDYDDVIYPEGWRLLIAELEASGAAIAFGGILNASVTRAGLVPYVTGKTRVFQGSGLAQLLAGNFCPVHSFVVDRDRAEVDLWADESLGFLEDYDLLLRLCSRHPSSFRLKDKIVGEYLFKDDGSNDNPLARPENFPAWRVAEAAVEARKAELVLSPAVQLQLGTDQPGLTVAGFLGRR